MDLKLFVVMVIVPFIGNAVQFWLTDTILKKKEWTDRDKVVRGSFFIDKSDLNPLNPRSELVKLDLTSEELGSHDQDTKNHEVSLSEVLGEGLGDDGEEFSHDKD